MTTRTRAEGSDRTICRALRSAVDATLAAETRPLRVDDDELERRRARLLDEGGYAPRDRQRPVSLALRALALTISALLMADIRVSSVGKPSAHPMLVPRRGFRFHLRTPVKPTGAVLCPMRQTGLTMERQRL